MDIVTTPPYIEMQKMYKQYFSLGRLNTDITSKFALISLTCFLTNKVNEKKADATHYQVLRKIAGPDYPTDFLKGLAVICSDFTYGCKEFPTFGIPPKEVPKKIKELLDTCLPF